MYRRRVPWRSQVREFGCKRGASEGLEHVDSWGSTEAQKAGLRSGPVYDIKNGWDLTTRAVQDRVLQEIKERRPELVVICPPCGPFSIMQNMNRKRDSNAWLREQAKARILLRFGMRVAQRQIECGRLFMFEHPVGAVSWKDRTVVHVSKQDTVQTVRLDQCMVGLRDRVSQKPHMKPTYIMTNSQHIARELSIRCDRSHVHEHVLGSVRVDGERKARSELSQEYPKEMCRRVVRGLMREKREKEETRVRHSVLSLSSCRIVRMRGKLFKC